MISSQRMSGRNTQVQLRFQSGTKQIAIEFQIYGPGKVWFDELDARFVDTRDAKKKSDGHVSDDSVAATETVEIPRADSKSKHPTGGSTEYLLIDPDAKSENQNLATLSYWFFQEATAPWSFSHLSKTFTNQALGGKFVVAELIAI